MEKKTAKKTQPVKAPDTNDVLLAFMSMMKKSIDKQAIVNEAILTKLSSNEPKQVEHVEPKEPVMTNEISYQVYGEIATKFEYEMSIEILWEYNTREQAEKRLAEVRELYLGKPYDKYSSPIYFKTFNIKENITKVIS